jgi:hypothetical protein
MEGGGTIFVEIFEDEEGHFIIAIQPMWLLPADGRFEILGGQLRWLCGGSDRTLKMAQEGAEGIIDKSFRIDRTKPVLWQDSI